MSVNVLLFLIPSNPDESAITPLYPSFYVKFHAEVVLHGRRSCGGMLGAAGSHSRSAHSSAHKHYQVVLRSRRSCGGVLRCCGFSFTLCAFPLRTNAIRLCYAVGGPVAAYSGVQVLIHAHPL
jgi:hypothetical protein